MKKLISVLLVMSVFLITCRTTACAEELSVSAQAYALYCVENESLIAGKNSGDKLKMASTTKIMTTLLTLEQAKENDCIVEFSEDMIAEGSSMYLQLSDKVRLSDLACGMMMCSGNDAANAAAITIGGSIEEFAVLMNNKAEQIGMNDTNFVTPSGLDDDNHHSTAYDMAKLMAYSMENEDFAQLTGSKQQTVDFVYPDKEVTYNNHNKLLSMYEYCIGGKTGYTKSAGRCLVSVAKKDSVTLVCVTLNAPSDWQDHISLYEYGFNKLKALKFNESGYTVDVIGADKNKIKVYPQQTSCVVEKDLADKVQQTVYLPPFVYAPMKKGEQTGVVIYSIDDHIVAQVPLCVTEDIILNKKNKSNNIWQKIFRK